MEYFQIFLAGLKYGVCRIWHEKKIWNGRVNGLHLEPVNVSSIGHTSNGLDMRRF